MVRFRPLWPLAAVMALIAVPLLPLAATSQSPKHGGVLVTSPLSATPSLSPHEESTVATVQQASPCFNNLVYYDPAKKQESVDSIIPELAEKWSWQDGNRNLVLSRSPPRTSSTPSTWCGAPRMRKAA
jgi:peptide/nickel transport system substrate-binding protein